MNSIGMRQVAAGRGAEWLGESWNLFRQAPGIWIGILVVWLLIGVVAEFIPVAGPLAMTLLGPVFTAGICLGCRSLDSGQGLRLEHLFAAFRGDRLGPLITVGALGLAGVLVLALIGGLMGFGALFAGGHMAEGPHHAGGGMLLAALVVLALIVPWAMALWFAAPLVALDGLAPIDSLKLSFRACLQNVVPMLIWGVLAFVLLVLAAIPLLLGWLVALPLLLASYYCMYRDIFRSGAESA